MIEASRCHRGRRSLPAAAVPCDDRLSTSSAPVRWWSWTITGQPKIGAPMSEVNTLSFMRGWVIVVLGVVFCAVTSFLGDTSLLMGAVTQSWVPYLAVPFAVGFAAVGMTAFRAGLLGALSSVLLVTGFYAVSPFDTSGLPVSTDGIYEYAPLGIVTGFLLAALSRFLAPRVARAPGRWALACCSILTLALIASWSILGWGVHEVITSSGVVTVGESTADVIASSVIVLAFSCAVIVFAIHGLPGRSDQHLLTKQSAPPQQDQPEPSR